MFYHSEEQRLLAEKSKLALEACAIVSIQQYCALFLRRIWNARGMEILVFYFVDRVIFRVVPSWEQPIFLFKNFYDLVEIKG
ncbi:MAG: hypothetical protein ACRKFN_13895 [Desulfitobacterium sp.]